MCVFVLAGGGGREGGQLGATPAGGRRDRHHQRGGAEWIQAGGRRSDQRILQDPDAHRPQVRAVPRHSEAVVMATTSLLRTPKPDNPTWRSLQSHRQQICP